MGTRGSKERFRVELAEEGNWDIKYYNFAFN